MKKHKKGFVYTHTKIERDDIENEFKKRFTYKYWFLGKDIMMIQRIDSIDREKIL